MYKKGNFVYEGKAKQIYQVEGQENLVWVHFKDSLTAFNAEKKGSFLGKGRINREVTCLIFDFLKSKGIENHIVSVEGETELVCQKVDIIPLEVVVRNQLAGSAAKRFHRSEGTEIPFTLVEWYYKNDEMGDPFINDDHALLLEAVQEKAVLQKLRHQALEINQHLVDYFLKANIRLIDYKLEFGFDSKGELILADEITADSCRLWDVETNEKLDKDRFRHDLGRVEDSYLEVLKRLQTVSGEKKC